MGVVSMKQLLEAGVHFGHQTRRWNPKMAEYIFTERNGIYIIDLQKTVKTQSQAIGLSPAETLHVCQSSDTGCHRTEGCHADSLCDSLAHGDGLR